MPLIVVSRIRFSSPEYEKALAIRREVFVGEQNVPEEIEVDDYETSSEHFLATVDGVPAGTGRLRVKNSAIKFERIATLKKFRGTGVGTKLMDALLQHARTHHRGLLPLMHSQASAMSFYSKLGWTTEGDVFYEAGIPHQVMTFR